MKRRLIVLPSAARDLDEHFRYIDRDSEAAANRLLESAEKLFDDLRSMSFLGRPREATDPRLAGLRSIGLRGFRRHLVFYIPMAEHVVILRVLHGARDLDRVLAEWLDEEPATGLEELE